MPTQLKAILRETAIQLVLCVAAAALAPALTVGTLYATGGFWPLILIIPIVAIIGLWFKRWRLAGLVALTAWVCTLVWIVHDFSTAMGN